MDAWNKDEHLMPVYMRALDTVRTVVDLMSFSNGVGLTVVLDTLIEPDGVSSQLVAQQPDLAPLSTAVKNQTPATNAVDNNFDRVPAPCSHQRVSISRAP